MSSMRYTEVNKAEALKQVTERGHSAHEVTGRLGMSQDTLYRWIREARKAQTQGTKERRDCAAEAIVQGHHVGSRHPPKGRRVLCQGIPERYAISALIKRSTPSPRHAE